MSEEVRTWHYGLVARWWAEFNQAGEDIEFFQGAIERAGEPVLDAGCGVGGSVRNTWAARWWCARVSLCGCGGRGWLLCVVVEC